MIDRVTETEAQELARRERLYRGQRPPPDLSGRTVILIDDGLATGSTMRAAAEAVRQQRPARLIVAVPIAARETCEELRSEVDEVVCAVTPDPFRAVGLCMTISHKRVTTRSESCSRGAPASTLEQPIREVLPMADPDAILAESVRRSAIPLDAAAPD